MPAATLVKWTQHDRPAAAGNHRSQLAVANCYMKPYASCRHIHAMVDAVLDMAGRMG